MTLSIDDVDGKTAVVDGDPCPDEFELNRNIFPPDFEDSMLYTKKLFVKLMPLLTS